MLNLIRKNMMKEKKAGKLIIGVVTTHSGAGGTHFSMALATYFSEWLGLKTSYLEFKSKSSIGSLEEFFYGKKSENLDKISVGRITFYDYHYLPRISEIIGDESDCVILDIGHNFSENINEFLRCDLKIVISSIAIWKQEELLNFLSSQDISKAKDWKYVIPFTYKKGIKENSRKFHIPMYEMPYQPDPFTITDSNVSFFKNLLQK